MGILSSCSSLCIIWGVHPNTGGTGSEQREEQLPGCVVLHCTSVLLAELSTWNSFASQSSTPCAGLINTAITLLPWASAGFLCLFLGCPDSQASLGVLPNIPALTYSFSGTVDYKIKAMLPTASACLPALWVTSETQGFWHWITSSDASNSLGRLRSWGFWASAVFVIQML